MDKGLIGIKLLRVLLILLGIYSLSAAYYFIAEPFSQMPIAIFEQEMKKSIAQLDRELNKKEQEIKDAEKSAELQQRKDSFNKEINYSFEKFQKELNINHRVLSVVALILGGVSLFSGFFLGTYSNQIRKLTFLSLVLAGAYYLLINFLAIYPTIFFVEYVIEKGNALFLFINAKQSMVLQDPAQRAVFKVCFNTPMVFNHLVVFGGILCSILYLTNSRVRAYFK